MAVRRWMDPGGRRIGRLPARKGVQPGRALSAQGVRRGGGDHAGVATRSGIAVEQPGKAASDWRKPVSAEITELAMSAGSETAG